VGGARAAGRQVWQGRQADGRDEGGRQSEKAPGTHKRQGEESTRGGGRGGYVGEGVRRTTVVVYVRPRRWLGVIG
jgi:hypothetical protein